MVNCSKFMNDECDDCNKCYVMSFLNKILNGDVTFKTRDEFVLLMLNAVYSDD